MNDTLSGKFSALADPSRRTMLSRIAQGRVSVSDLAKPFSAEDEFAGRY